MENYLRPALRLHQHLSTICWNGQGLVGPDAGVRFNFRVGRFIKSYFRDFPWNDSYYYLQTQGYWVLANWRLFLYTGERAYQEIAVRCSEHMLERQRKDGAWDHPNPEWKGRVATAECTWGSLGLLETYRHTSECRFLAGAQRWHHFLLKEVGFSKVGDELAVNYFAHVPRARVPNNSGFVLRFLAELADLTGEGFYLEPCAGLVTFMRRAQKTTGEFPYMVRDPAVTGRCWEHFQCYQYNAFQFMDLLRYYQLTGDSAVPPVLTACLAFLRSGQADDGHSYYQCGNRHREVIYNTAAMGAAFAGAASIGLQGYEELAERAFSYLRRMQAPTGTFPASRGDYYILSDRRSYPRCLSMILFHFLVALTAAGAQRPAFVN